MRPDLSLEPRAAKPLPVESEHELHQPPARIERDVRILIGAVTWLIVAPLPACATGLKLIALNRFKTSTPSSKLSFRPDAKRFLTFRSNRVKIGPLDEHVVRRAVAAHFLDAVRPVRRRQVAAESADRARRSRWPTSRSC